MSNKRETLADIARDLRGRAGCAERHGDRETHNDGVAMFLRSIADRIEAIDSADAWRSLYTPGNAAAMREALAGIRALIADEPDGTPMIDAMKATIEVALAAPPRNCDRFQVAAEALQEWQSLVKAKPNTWDFRYNHWLFAPAAEREGEGDGR